MQPSTTEFWAAVDSGVTQGVVGSGAVYGVGRTPDQAVTDAEEWSAGSTGYDVVPCSRAAAALVEAHGGAPGVGLSVTRHGVDVAEVDVSEPQPSESLARATANRLNDYPEVES